MNVFKKAVVIGLTALCMTVVIGCRNMKSTLEQTNAPAVPGADTTFVETSGFQNIDTTDDAVFEEAQLAQDIERKAREMLQPVYFAFNSFQLSPEGIERLAAVSTFLTDYPQLRVLVEGHCDERGSSEYNMGLGEKRARSVKEYLVNYGITAIRLEITSWGKEHPARPYCTDDACHGLNRRAEFKVLAR